ncbi:MAG: hypothetical protein AAGA48_02125 [Myxococcota bacterium]
MEEHHTSDGEQEVWAVLAQVRTPGFGVQARFVPGLAVLALAACVLGPFGFLFVAAIYFMMSVDPLRSPHVNAMRRYRRIRLDPSGIRVDWLDELDTPPTQAQLLQAPGLRSQRIAWDEVSSVENRHLAVLIRLHSGKKHLLTGFSLDTTQALYERLHTVWRRVDEGAPSPDAAATRRSQLEQLVSERPESR